MTDSKYYTLTGASHDDYCAINDYPDDLEEIHRPSDGVAMGEVYELGQVFEMDEDVAGIQVADVIKNALGYLLVSDKAKKVLAASAKAPIEYLQFTLHNHKGRVASDTLWIVNVLGDLDCVDMDASEGRTGAKEHLFEWIQKLVLRPDAIPDDADIFRIAARPQIIVIRADLRDALVAAGLVGAEMIETGEAVDFR
jgi:hypothetical protein